MEEDTVGRLPRPGASVSEDPLLEVLRSGARRMLQQVIEAEVEAFLGAHGELEDAHGRRRVVRNGHASEREIQTGIGPIAVRRPKLRDRGDGAGGERIRFTSKVLPPVLRRTKNVEELLPWLYLKGVSTGQFEEALTALLGPDAPGLSASTVRRLRDENGLTTAPDLATGDGALGFWKALLEVWPTTWQQRCLRGLLAASLPGIG